MHLFLAYVNPISQNRWIRSKNTFFALKVSLLFEARLTMKKQSLPQGNALQALASSLSLTESSRRELAARNDRLRYTLNIQLCRYPVTKGEPWHKSYSLSDRPHRCKRGRLLPDKSRGKSNLSSRASTDDNRNELLFPEPIRIRIWIQWTDPLIGITFPLQWLENVFDSPNCFFSCPNVMLGLKCFRDYLQIPHFFIGIKR